ncbi:hypothetical protein ACFLT7_07995 [candidate division KSB1 bacterium]
MTFEWLDFVPIWAVKLGVVLFLAAILVWIRLLPAAYILKDAPDDKWWRDIRWWALGIFAILALICVVL